jgi:hypothetical protein
MTNFLGDFMSLLHRELRVHGDAQLGVQAVAQPPDVHPGHVLHTRGVARGVLDLFDHFRINPVEQAREHRSG